MCVCEPDERLAVLWPHTVTQSRRARPEGAQAVRVCCRGAAAPRAWTERAVGKRQAEADEAVKLAEEATAAKEANEIT